MTPREIIAESWHITRKYRRVLLPWGVADALVLMIWAIGFVSYQGYALGAFFRSGTNPSWGSVVKGVAGVLGGSTGHIVTTMTLLILYGILWVIIPRFATGAMIGLAAKIRCGDEPKGGLVLGVFNFFPLLELAAALGAISGKTFFSGWSVLVRYMGGGDVLFGTSALLLILWVVSFLFHFFFTFAEEAIVIRKLSVFRALGQSFKLVISYLSKVVLLFILLLVIILRIIINALVILLIPSMVMGLGLLLARFLPSGISFSISGTLGLAVLLFASYFVGYITVFKHTAWTITYLELSKEKELDIIETPPPSEKTEDEKPSTQILEEKRKDAIENS